MHQMVVTLSIVLHAYVRRDFKELVLNERRMKLVVNECTWKQKLVLPKP